MRELRSRLKVFVGHFPRTPWRLTQEQITQALQDLGQEMKR
jgi:hypothetical protein